ncbi:MAG: PTS sugar transporter subunit IIA [Candidatus Hydrogenedentes bacterium]|nr:PTS sugar transporter subunit IIA [Candidatus Hydrogenedentota bacterium]
MKTYLIAPEQCAAHIEVADSDALLHAVAQRASGSVKGDETDIYKALRKRETTISTGLKDGIALPHCALPKIETFTIGIITLAKPIDYKSLDGELSDLFIFVVGSVSGRTEHVHILGAISKQVRESSVRERLRTASSDKELAAILQSWFQTDDQENTGESSLLLVYVQNNDLYKKILEAVSWEADASVAVSQAQSAGSILNRVPLFASFWQEQESNEINRIEILLPRHRTNLLIRQIEELSKDKSGVQICAIELSYGSGTLDL